MSYLLDKKAKRKKVWGIVSFAILFVFLFYFNAPVFYGLSYVSNIVFRPFLIFGVNVGNKLDSLSAYFASKESLTQKISDLNLELAFSQARVSNYDTILQENEKLKEIFGRKKEETTMILAVILSKPNRSLYDTLLIDAGSRQGVSTGDLVYALGNVPIGRVEVVYDNSAKVILFSSSGEKMEVIVGETFFELVGRGGGNFEMILPRGTALVKGNSAVLPGLDASVVGVVETIISDPRDSFQKVLLISPVNIQELKFVEIKK